MVPKKTDNQDLERTEREEISLQDQAVDATLQVQGRKEELGILSRELEAETGKNGLKIKVHPELSREFVTTRTEVMEREEAAQAGMREKDALKIRRMIELRNFLKILNLTQDERNQMIAILKTGVQDDPNDQTYDQLLRIIPEERIRNSKSSLRPIANNPEESAEVLIYWDTWENRDL